MIPALVVSIPFLFVLARRPILRRLAVRNAVRRPREALLVVLGSMFGTAIITGSLVVGDTIQTSVRHLAHTQLGPIDEVVATPDLRVFEAALARIRGASSDLVDGTLGFGRLDVAVSTGEGAARRAAPRSQLLEIDFAQAASFGGDTRAAGISGPTPAAGHAVVTDDLAVPLGLRPGMPLHVYAYGEDVALTVDRVVPSQGVAGYWRDFGSRSRNVLVGPGTLARLTALVASQLGSGRFPAPEWIVAVSNRGGVEDGAALTSEVTHRLSGALSGLELRPVPVKQDVLASADREAAGFRRLFSAMGTFGVLAGVLLLVNIFVMLGEERKSELGMLRAVGLRRASLVGAFSTEGWLYSLAASAVGTLVGRELGAAIIGFIDRIFSRGRQEFAFPLRFSATSQALVGGFSAGLVIAVVTVVLTSTRLARFNVIRAIRDLPEPRVWRPRLRWLVLGGGVAVVGAAMGVGGWTSGVPFAALVGPMLAFTGVVPIASRVLGARTAITAAAAAVIGWGIGSFGVLPRLGRGFGVEVFVAQGVAMTAAAVTLVTQQHDRLEQLARRFGAGRWAMSIRLGLAYPMARRLRTGLTLAMYSLVIFTLTFIAALSGAFQGQLDHTTARAAGGYQVFVTSNPANPVTPEQLKAVPGVVAVAPLARVRASFRRPGAAEATDWTLSAFDERLIASGRAPRLGDRGPYRTDEEAYRAVMADPGLILADPFFLRRDFGPGPHGVRVGDRLTMIDPLTGRSREVQVAAMMSGDYLINGAFYGEAGARAMFGGRVVPERAYVAVEGRAASDVVADVNGRYVAQGANADTIRAIVATSFAVQNQFFRLFEGYLALGLLVGIAGLGVVMVRAVRERRREIGVLRALGFLPETVRRSFTFESTFVALEGTLVGVSLALLTVYNVVRNSHSFGENIPFSVPFAALSVLVGGALAASLAATAAPTRAAARIRPAVALRIAD